MSFLGGLIGGAIGFITGGPAGAVIGAATGASAGSSAGAVQAGLQAPTYRQPVPQAGGISSGALSSVLQGGPVGMATRNPPSSGFGFAATTPPAGTTAPAGATAAAPTGSAMSCTEKGHHLNKSKYYTTHLGGAVITTHEKGSTCVKNRRMNVGNARALRHALRRARGFEKLAMRTIRILHPTKRGRFAGFKTRRRSR